jgi:MFS superfamily sulfate permease-like transporter
LFVTPEDQEKTSDPYIHYYSEERLGTLIKVIIAVVSTALLLIPIYLFLSCNISLKWMASIVLFFSLVFATAVSVFTSARRQEVFAATAAYCAVLVVFIGNIQQRQISG